MSYPAAQAVEEAAAAEKKETRGAKDTCSAAAYKEEPEDEELQRIAEEESRAYKREAGRRSDTCVAISGTDDLRKVGSPEKAKALSEMAVALGAACGKALNDGSMSTSFCTGGTGELAVAFTSALLRAAPGAAVVHMQPATSTTVEFHANRRTVYQDGSPEGRSITFDVPAGSNVEFLIVNGDDEYRQRKFAEKADVVLCIGGGPGTHKEVMHAAANNAFVVPAKGLGGIAGGETVGGLKLPPEVLDMADRMMNAEEQQSLRGAGPGASQAMVAATQRYLRTLETARERTSKRHRK